MQRELNVLIIYADPSIAPQPRARTFEREQDECREPGHMLWVRFFRPASPLGLGNSR